MTDAEQAVRKAAADIPAEVRERLDTADKLSDEDRETIIDIARQALARSAKLTRAQPESKRRSTQAKPEPEEES